MKTGKRAHAALFSFTYLSSPRAGAAVVISKKVAKTAVGRNLLRRRTYAALRIVMPKLLTPISLVCIAKPALVGTSVREIESALILQFKQKTV